MYEKLFKALGEGTRMRIVRLLAEEEFCICELEQIMQISQPRISQHMKILKDAGLVTERREGQRRVCSFNRQFFEEQMTDFNRFMGTALKDLSDFKEEYQRIKHLEEIGCNPD